MKNVEKQMDLYFDRVRVSEEVLVRNLNNKSEISFMFKTNNRKRLGSVSSILEKLVEKEIKGVEKIECLNFRKDQFEKRLLCYKKDEQLSVRESDKFVYKGSGVEVFKNKKNFFSWQSDLENMLFERGTNVIKKAKDKEIILYRYGKGNSGKSSFLKYLYFKNMKDIGFIRGRIGCTNNLWCC